MGMLARFIAASRFVACGRPDLSGNIWNTSRMPIVGSVIKAPRKALPVHENIGAAVVPGQETVLPICDPGLQSSAELGRRVERLGLVIVEVEIAKFDRHGRTFIAQR